MNYRNKEWLKKQYVDLHKSTREIGKICGCSKDTISTHLRKFCIDIRPNKFQKGNTINKGREPWNKNTIGVMKKNKTSFKKGQNKEEKNVNWKGDNVGYRSIHEYVERRKEKPNECDYCGKENCRLELSFDHSLGKHTRNIEDYKYLCSKCHKVRDGGIILIYS